MAKTKNFGRISRTERERSVQAPAAACRIPLPSRSPEPRVMLRWLLPGMTRPVGEAGCARYCANERQRFLRCKQGGTVGIFSPLNLSGVIFCCPLS